MTKHKSGSMERISAETVASKKNCQMFLLNFQSTFGGEICIMIKNSYTIEERGRKKEMCGENNMSSLI
jgi:hypothetical protein